MRNKWWRGPVGGCCAALVSALLTKGHQPRSIADRWRPPNGAGSCCDLQSLYLTRERLIIASKLTGPRRWGRFLTDIAIPHSAYCQRALLLTLRCQACWAPRLLSATPPWSFSLITILYSLQDAAHPGRAHRPNKRCQLKAKIHCQTEFTYVFDRCHFTSDLCVRMSERGSVRENKSCPKQENKRAMIPLCVSTLMVYWCPADVLSHFLYLKYLVWDFFLSCSAVWFAF